MPARRCASARSSLAPADRHDDLERVALREPRAQVLAARNDLAVLLHRDALPGELERLQETRDVRAGLQARRLAVDGKLDHLKLRRRSVELSYHGCPLTVATLPAGCHALSQFFTDQETTLGRQLCLRPAASSLQ